MRVRISPQARADLDELWLYIAKESGSETLATRVVGALADKFALFSKFPFIGRTLESAQRPDVRSFPVDKHIIFYSIKPNEIRILRIIHSSQDAWTVFRGE
jgi:toxin ParE1/3/4